MGATRADVYMADVLLGVNGTGKVSALIISDLVTFIVVYRCLCTSTARNVLYFSFAWLFATTYFLWLCVHSIAAKYQLALLISGLVTFIVALSVKDTDFFAVAGE